MLHFSERQRTNEGRTLTSMKPNIYIYVQETFPGNDIENTEKENKIDGMEIENKAREGIC